MVARRVKSNRAERLNGQAAGCTIYRLLEQLADVLVDIARSNLKEVKTDVKRAHGFGLVEDDAVNTD